jgi:hypothetical protein
MNPHAPRSIVAVFGGVRQRGPWRLGRRLLVVAAFGAVDLDLGTADLTTPEASIAVVALFGGVGLAAPPELAVELSGLSLFGGKGDRRPPAPPAPGPPVVRVRALVLFGGVTVKPRRTWTLRSPFKPKAAAA